MEALTFSEAQSALTLGYMLAEKAKSGGDVVLRPIDLEFVVFGLFLAVLASGHAERVNGLPVLRVNA